MAIYAIVAGTLVVGTIIWDGVTPYSPPPETILVMDTTGGKVARGWTYSGGVFTNPNPPLPPPTTAASAAAATYKQSLIQRADALQKIGESYDAIKLLLKAQGVPP